MTDDEKYAAALEHQSKATAAAQLMPPDVVSPQGNYASGSLGGMSHDRGGMSDFHIRSAALEVALRYAKSGEPFLETIGRARAFYMFLTDKS